MKRILYGAAIAGLLAIGFTWAFNWRPQPAPNSSFVLLDGAHKTTDDWSGKVTLVEFWATSCAICLAEMPKLVATHQKYSSRAFDTIAVAMRYDPPSNVVLYAQQRKLPFAIAIDNTGAIAKSWGDVELTPTLFVLNKQGKIVKRYEGEPDFAELHLVIDQLLTHS